MDESSKSDLAILLEETCDLYGKEFKQNLVGVWWRLLRNYDFTDVEKAITTYQKRSKFFPKPAEIIERIDGSWIGADEAWALMPKSEADTAPVTQAMLAAWSVATDQYHSGDEVGARMAFKQAYNRYVSKAQDAGERQSVSLSIGYDVSKREQAIKDALQRKLISPAIAEQHMLALPKDPGIIAGLISGKVKEDDTPEYLKKRWEDIKSEIEKAGQRRVDEEEKKTEEYMKKKTEQINALKDMQKQG